MQSSDATAMLDSGIHTGNLHRRDDIAFEAKTTDTNAIWWRGTRLLLTVMAITGCELFDVAEDGRHTYYFFQEVKRGTDVHEGWRQTGADCRLRNRNCERY